MQTFTPSQYLKIDIANNFGLDKEAWDDRIAWFDKNEEILEGLVDTAEEPALFFAGVRAWRQAQQGQDIKYPISLDATASGAQILSALIGCPKSARLCNVIDTGSREDLYTNVFGLMCSSLGAQVSLERKDVKQAVMTSLYGSTAVPKRVFGEGDRLDTFYQVMSDEAQGIWVLNEALLNLWDPTALSNDWVMPDNFHVKVKVMDKQVDQVWFLDAPHDVVTSVNRPMEKGLSIGANATHSVDGMIVREVLRRCKYDPEQRVKAMDICLNAPQYSDVVLPMKSKNTTTVQTLLEHYRRSGFLSARIVEHIDESSIMHFSKEERNALWELLESMPEKPFNVLAVHDCFRVHPNYGNDLRRQYNRILHDIARSELLADITTQIARKPMSAPKFADIADDILDANYALS